MQKTIAAAQNASNPNSAAPKTQYKHQQHKPIYQNSQFLKQQQQQQQQNVLLSECSSSNKTNTIAIDIADNNNRFNVNKTLMSMTSKLV